MLGTCVILNEHLSYASPNNTNEVISLGATGPDFPLIKHSTDRILRFSSTGCDVERWYDTNGQCRHLIRRGEIKRGKYE